MSILMDTVLPLLIFRMKNCLRRWNDKITKDASFHLFSRRYIGAGAVSLRAGCVACAPFAVQMHEKPSLFLADGMSLTGDN